ncbi:DUF4907 domain-containing protein [Flavobacterium sp. MAHUQ-51]|uniref:DUF4907 domain-containing protein n=1 Tax=Flavobacterium sp. GCM10022190 TaxID=3252639 RepID=UPI00361B1703
MTINKKQSKFFWNTIQKNFSLKKVKFLVLLSCLFLSIACNHKKELSLASIKTTTGWGYIIKLNDKVIIKQSIIPVIQNQKSFESEEEALKVGNLVLNKLKAKTSPTITKKDLILLSIKT